MIDFLIRQCLPWLLSAITIYMTILAGNKHPRAWLIGLVNQILWLIWILGTQSWGFIPMNIALGWVYLRNHLKWNNTDGRFDLSNDGWFIRLVDRWALRLRGDRNVH